jgi:hypothetical protein
VTLTKRTITYAKRYPGQSATQIANALRAKASSVSSILHKAVARGQLERSTADWSGKGNFWNVAGGGGPAGGHIYYAPGRGL